MLYWELSIFIKLPFGILRSFCLFLSSRLGQVLLYIKMCKYFVNKTLLHECSGFIEFTERVGERGGMRGLSSILPLFRSEFGTFIYARFEIKIRFII